MHTNTNTTNTTANTNKTATGPRTKGVWGAPPTGPVSETRQTLPTLVESRKPLPANNTKQVAYKDINKSRQPKEEGEDDDLSDFFSRVVRRTEQKAKWSGAPK
eukprot:gnl/Chilomastix_caulleri/1314.p3 GENE.gnl/Chilomastix_caulleri/1314~~gnl/Chilomastix_caulleri/1314.p3  ORF type:complete len:103 (+),score=45.78 gnl/Chilomastix_caulleri/1314:284-592(+)